MAEKNRRILQGTDIIYPFTKQENVIGLQKTITDKLPIVSESTPQSGYVPKQVWVDIGDAYDNHSLQFGNRGGGLLNFGQQEQEEVVELSFGRTPGQEENQRRDLTFGESSVDNNEN